MFQKTIVSKYLKTQKPEVLTEKWTAFCAHFKEPAIQENIRNSKEEQYQGEFLIDLFVQILGYTKNPAPNFNLTTELKNIKDSRKADGAILFEGKTTAVIELKGTNTTDLGKIEDQAFGYKNNQEKTCRYVITSNFEKLRFYIDNAVEHLEFNLFELSQDQFNLLFLCLACENLKSGIPAKIKEESVSQEDVITKKLYKDYSVFKRELFQNFVSQNPGYDALELFKKTQKLLDRLLFLFFGEDRGLLPPNSVRQILEQWNKLNELDEYVALYSRFKKYFGYLNTGFKGKQHDVFAYNGGLFKPDEILDHIQIDDQLLYQHALKLSEYDFASEVDVNILGHIFENSLNEIDEIKAQLEGKEIDKAKTKRKKDGVFYTPKYITQYIVENTVGKLCEEKKAELGIAEEDYFTDKKRQQKTRENLLQKLEQYRNWLLEITIVDPACGSGAFLNEALNFLIEEHQYVDELEAKLTGSSIAFGYHSENILENNLFGVDLNEESVEIAKLSLWLRTAVPNRKLNDLSHNIKCGNSLIDDPEVAGEKAFNWQQEFPQVFEKGGFDVVIWNPPYVGTKQIEENFRNYFWKRFEDLLFSEMDLYELFLYFSINNLLRIDGFLGFITPNSYYTNISFKKLRQYLLEQTKINQIIDFPYRFYPFQEVNTETSIILIKKEYDIDNEVEFKIVDKHLQQITNGMYDVFKNSTKQNQLEIIQNFDSKFILNLNPIVRKVKSEKKFGDYLSLHKGWMSIPKSIQNDFVNFDKAIFTKSQVSENDHLNKYSSIFLEGRDIHRYYVDKVEKFVYRRDIDKITKEWHFAPKIILQRIVGQNKNKIFATVDFSNSIIFPNANLVNLINDEYDIHLFLGILNSTLISYYYNCYYGESNTNLTKLAFESLPIPNLDLMDDDKISGLVILIISLNKQLQELSEKFLRTVSRKFEGVTLTKKLQDWHLLSYAEFIRELVKQKIKLSLSEEAEWEDYFNAEQAKAVALQSEITQTDKEIDRMVYELYGLTEEEVEIVEQS